MHIDTVGHLKDSVDLSLCMYDRVDLSYSVCYVEHPNALYVLHENLILSFSLSFTS